MILSVLNFGATGDGLTDDTHAIQAAIVAAQIAGDTVYVPRGNYLITGTVAVTAPCQITGDGFGSQLWPRMAGACLYWKARADSVLKGAMMRDFAILANGTGAPNTGLIQMQAVEFLIDHLWLQGAPSQTLNNGRSSNGVGISNYAAGSLNTSQGVMQNCTVENTSKSGIDWTGGACNGLITGNTFRGCGGYGETPGIQIGGGFNGKVIGNSCYGNEGAGILLMTQVLAGQAQPPARAIVQGNHCYGNGRGGRAGGGICVVNGYGAVPGSDSGTVVIEGNVCYGDTNSNGILIQNTRNVLVSGNVCRENRNSGIAVDGCHRVSLVGNHAISNGQAGLWFRASESLLVSGNQSYNEANTALQQKFGIDWVTAMTDVIAQANLLGLNSIAPQGGFVPVAP